MILVVDHFDSFVETLARYTREAGCETRVIRVDHFTPAMAAAPGVTGVILSPGPGRPSDTPATTEVFRAVPDRPVLGVCLGHQALCEAYGGATVRSPFPMHGRASEVRHDGDALFAGVPSPFAAGRYHSLLGDLPEGGPLRPIAWEDATGLLMAARHRDRLHAGVQFHPESLLTPHGRRILGNFLALAATEGGRQ